MRRARAVLLLLLPLLPASVIAQQTSGSIRGRVTYGADLAADNAQVVISAPRWNVSRSVTSDRDGFFALNAVAPGEYTVRVTRLGMRPITIDRVTVHLGRTTPLSVRMETQAVSLDEFRVVAQGQTIDPVHTDMGATLNAADYAALPGERDYKSMLSILPHASNSHRGDPVNVAGSSGLENVYYIDGVNVTAQLRAETGTALPYNFVRAVEVKTGGYEAQYGKALGAIVNAITYTGSNDFEAHAFGFTTSDRLASSPKSQPTLREVSSETYDAGVRVGGPIFRDRMWYSAAYNPQVAVAEREIGTIRGLVKPGGQIEDGMFRDERIAHVFATKLNWQPSEYSSLEFSLFGDPTVHNFVAVPLGVLVDYTPLSPDSYLGRRETGGTVVSTRFSTVVGRFLIDASISRSTGRDHEYGATATGRDSVRLVDDVEGTVAGGYGFASRSDLGRHAVTLRGSATIRGHSITIGAEYEDVVARRQLGISGGMLLSRIDTDLFIAGREMAGGTLHNRVPTFYVQDSWRAGSRLTLNAGVRLSTQTLTSASGGVGQRFANEWQPRFGFVWQPRSGDEVRDRILGSYGRFYIQEPLNLSTLWYLDYVFVDEWYSSDPRVWGAAPDSITDGSTLERDYARSIPGAAAENFDEFTVAYERLIGRAGRVTLRGVRRDLRSSFGFGFASTNPIEWVLGTRGEGDFDFLPRAKREYTAVELSTEGVLASASFRASYVWSRSYGNYSGLFTSDLGFANPGGSGTFAAPHQAARSTGLLPNDRTHALKVAVSRHVIGGLSAGTSASVESGSPRNAFALGPAPLRALRSFVVPRGSFGRTPWLWDANMRFAYDLPARGAKSTCVLLDVLHIGNPQRPVVLEEVLYRANVDGAMFWNENPSFGQPRMYQPPMKTRLGIEASF